MLLKNPSPVRGFLSTFQIIKLPSSLDLPMFDSSSKIKEVFCYDEFHKQQRLRL